MHQPNHNRIRCVRRRFRFSSVLFSTILAILLVYFASASVVSAAGIGESIGNVIGNLLLSIAAFFTWLGGIMLDHAIAELILGMGAKLSQPSIKAAIDNSWTIIRDVCNLAFIFGFVWIGIKTIVDYGSASTKSMLASLIVAALLINFSLFFTKVIIDVSNMAAYQIYTTMIGPELAASAEGVEGIGTKFMNTMGIVTVFSTDGSVTLAGLTEDASLGFYFGAAMFLFVAAFVFAAGAILVAIRFAALLLIMIFSPVLFAATVFPQTKQFSTKLWGLLINYALFAPIYLLLVLVSYRLAEGLAGSERLNASSTFSNALRSDPSSFGVFITFTVITVLMVMALQAAKHLSIAGGTKAVSLGSSFVRGASGGMSGYFGRGLTRAFGLNKIANSVEEFQKSGKTGDRARAGFLRLTGINAVASAAQKTKWGSNRSVADVNKKNKELKQHRATNKAVDELAKVVEHGLRNGATPEDKIAMERAVAEASPEQLRPVLTKYEKGSAGYNTIVQAMSTSQIEKFANMKDEDFDAKAKSDLDEAKKEMVVKRLEALGGGNLQKGIGKASMAELKILGAKTIMENALGLSASQIDNIKKGTEFVETERARITDEYDKKLVELFENDTTRPDVFKKREPADIAKLPGKILLDARAAEFLGKRALSKIVDSKLEDHELAKIKNDVVTYHTGKPTFSEFDNYFKYDRLGKLYP